MDFQLSDEEEEVRQRARRFAQDVAAPRARASDEERRFYRETVTALGECGLLGGPISKAYGGAGLSYVAQALVYEELGAVDSSVRGFMAVQTGLVASCIQDWAREDQKQRWLPSLVDGSAIGCYCLTEPEAGSDVASMKSLARRDGEDWVLEGEKVWITNGGVADVCLLFVKTDPEATPKHRGISAFIVPADSPGLERERMEAPELGHRGSNHARVRFQNLRLPDEARLGDLGRGFRVAMSALDHGRLGVAAGAVGVHRSCLEESSRFAAQRKQFGVAIGQMQMVQKTLADMHCSFEAARLLTLKAAWEKDQGLKSTRSTSAAKLYATEAAAKAAHDAILLHGGRGYNNERPVERLLRDAIGMEIYEGSSNIQRMIIALDLIKDLEAAPE